MADYKAYTLAERPELKAEIDGMADNWAPFMNEDAVANEHFGRLYQWFPEYQLALCDADGEVVARALSVPITWDGTDASLPDAGWDWALLNAVETYENNLQPNAVSAIEIHVLPERRGEGLSTVALHAMKANVRAQGLDHLVAPVRPSLKASYPLTPMGNYLRWTHDADGAPFDPWVRVHWRDGARIARIAPESMRIVGTVARWETWAGMRFPESGRYVVPEALVPVEIDHDVDEGRYIEPNVWMVHTLG